MAPFLEVVTRHYAERPGLLRRNRESLLEQTDGDWQQTILIDREGVGVAGANQMIADYAPHVRGHFVWVLDDDDVCVNPHLVEQIKRIAARDNPDVIMMRMDHGPWGVLPPEKLWGKRPQYGKVGASAFVVRRELWYEHGHRWGRPHAGDHSFISAVWGIDPVVVWHSSISSRVQVASAHGRTEAQLTEAGLV